MPIRAAKRIPISPLTRRTAPCRKPSPPTRRLSRAPGRSSIDQQTHERYIANSTSLSAPTKHSAVDRRKPSSGLCREQPQCLCRRQTFSLSMVRLDLFHLSDLTLPESAVPVVKLENVGQPRIEILAQPEAAVGFTQSSRVVPKVE